MSPGINDQPNLGALPKSNRRSDRNRERDRLSINQWIDRAPVSPAQHTNNLFQLDWHPVCERTSTSGRSAKNSNTRYRPVPASALSSGAASTVSSTAYQQGDLESDNIHSQSFPGIFSREDINSWLKMTPPVDPRTQSPPNFPRKSTNTEKMPERSQVEGRLNQIRDYINVTTRMMESLSQSTDPRAQAQHEKLGKMVEDLYDSEQKLSKLMEDCQKYWNLNEDGEPQNGVSIREQELRKKVEESQQKLVQLQEHQAHLMDIEVQVRERLNEARQAQHVHQNMLVNMQLNEVERDEADEQRQRDSDSRVNGNVEQLERETEVLKRKLMQLENKKRAMDHLVQELQAVEMMGRAGSSSETSRPTDQRDKVAELEAMKAQLTHLKALMNEATGVEADTEPNNDNAAISEGSYRLEETESEDNARQKELPSVEHILAVTRELKEQHHMLQAARAELRRLNPQNNIPIENQPAPIGAMSVTSSTPPPTLFAEKKLSNNDIRIAQNNRRQIEDFMRKDQTSSPSVSQNGGQEWGSHRGSNSQHSHSSTPGNLWPPPTNLVTGMHDHNVDNVSVTENLLEVGSQPTIENGFPSNFWGMPTMVSNQSSQSAAVGSAEYYRQLLLGSQSQQLQMMSTTIQQCCQLLWAQQREMQTMKTAITQLQNQLRHNQAHPMNNLNIHDDPPSNLGRPNYSTLDPSMSTLPPSSSLPNLVTPPANCSSPAPPINTSNCQPQPLQLNNQVPPGNRANNYWDNFRSYSRQNLLSGSSKAATDYIASPLTHSQSGASTSNGIMVTSQVNKCNRLLCPENALTSSEEQYFMNLQSVLQQHQPLQHPERETGRSILMRNNYDTDFPPLNQSSQSIEAGGTDLFKDEEPSAQIAKKISKRDDLKLILMHCLKALKSQKPESPLPSSNVSNNSSDSSDEESASAAGAVASIRNTENVNLDNQIAEIDSVELKTMVTSETPASYSSILSNSLEKNVQFICNNQVSTDCAVDSIDQLVTNENSHGVCENEWRDTIPDLSTENLNATQDQGNLDYVILDRAQNSPTNTTSVVQEDGTSNEGSLENQIKN